MDFTTVFRWREALFGVGSQRHVIVALPGLNLLLLAGVAMSWRACGQDTLGMAGGSLNMLYYALMYSTAVAAMMTREILVGVWEQAFLFCPGYAASVLVLRNLFVTTARCL